MKAKTVDHLIEGNARAQAVVAALARWSVSFAFEPYPDDEYVVTVKNEGFSTRLIQATLRYGPVPVYDGPDGQHHLRLQGPSGSR